YLFTGNAARSSLFPYTTLFRSFAIDRQRGVGQDRGAFVGNQAKGEIDAELVFLDTALRVERDLAQRAAIVDDLQDGVRLLGLGEDRKSTRLNSSHVKISYAVFC